MRTRRFVQRRACTARGPYVPYHVQVLCPVVTVLPGSPMPSVGLGIGESCSAAGEEPPAGASAPASPSGAAPRRAAMLGSAGRIAWLRPSRVIILATAWPCFAERCSVGVDACPAVDTLAAAHAACRAWAAQAQSACAEVTSLLMRGRNRAQAATHAPGARSLRIVSGPGASAPARTVGQLQRRVGGQDGRMRAGVAQLAREDSRVLDHVRVVRVRANQAARLLLRRQYLRPPPRPCEPSCDP